MKIKVVKMFNVEIISIIVGIILCICQAVGVVDIGWFWATFPFWIVFAIDAVIILLIIIIVELKRLFS